MKALETLDVAKLRQKLKEEAEQKTGGPPGSSPSAAGLSPLAARVAEQLRRANRSPSMILGQFGLMEFSWLVATSLLAGWLFVGSSSESLLYQAGLGALGAGIFLVFAQFADSFQIHTLRRPKRSLKRALSCWLLVVFLMLGVCLLRNAQLPTFYWLAGWALMSAVLIVIERYAMALAIRNWTRNGIIERRAVVVGGGEPAKQLIRALESQTDNDIRICGIFDDRQGDRSPSIVAGYPKLGTVAELVTFARETRIDMLIIALPITAEARILELLKMLWVLPVDIRLAAHSNSLRFRPRAYSHIGDVPMLDLVDKPIRDWDSVAKRVFDIVFSLGALAVFWPVMLLAAIAIKATSKGPVLFVQKRHGFNNEVIKVLKFRSMYTEMSDPTAKLAVTKNDPRVTPIGRLLRKSSMDELPQLFNVLRGDLSLVGPRPHAVQAQTRDRHYGDIVESYFARHRVKPGVTGWAQVKGWRGEVDTDEKIKGRTACDLYYIENWSLLLDLKILVMTPISLFNTENAY
ncbi:undecaprenyl-phosphate glucose phosphotransferase [Allorhizobium taibaishanense]|uniref:Undecaprenyl-phosphate glucose phosphotransferase n=1 Tax=Allorhizobium taibaishanense TaxID=887144 RepID=A0A1Q8ZYT7_9HYPH|nr:undecaprenyl-phosphate glucose phosphotransferase [Allorhizobium taibaishanense]MBB4007557.1 Undecaprenyl-phosphate glucose phosphotransferase [Allorhizobium taibaishanense]OLP47504.1 undecaprenyl-phosphate glucose phosphotransferase [Allorhizobium taibaishanense]